MFLFYFPTKQDFIFSMEQVIVMSIIIYSPLSRPRLSIFGYSLCMCMQLIQVSSLQQLLQLVGRPPSQTSQYIMWLFSIYYL